MKPRDKAEQIFTHCFTKEELEFLKKQPQFIEAIRNIESLADTMKALETGERLVKETWSSGNHTDSRFTPKKLETSN